MLAADTRIKTGNGLDAHCTSFHQNKYWMVMLKQIQCHARYFCRQAWQYAGKLILAARTGGKVGKFCRPGR
jgi:hypothetical protein